MATEWFVQKNSQRVGPFTPQQLREMVQQSKLAPDDLVWRNGLDKPVRARKVQGLFEQVVPTPTQISAPAINQASPRQKVVPQLPPLPPAAELPPPVIDAELAHRHQITPPPICVDSPHDFSSDVYPEFVTTTGARVPSHIANSPSAKLQGATLPKPGWSSLDNRIVHSLLAIFCFPIGLFLIWKSGLWSTKAKWLWTGAVAGLLVVGALSPKSERGDSSSWDVKQTSTPDGQEIDKIRKKWEADSRKYGLPHGQKEWEEMDRRATKAAHQSFERDEHNTKEVKKWIESIGEHHPDLR